WDEWPEGREAGMTEREWLACEDAEQMLPWITDAAGPRKLFCLAVACIHRIAGLFHYAVSGSGRRAAADLLKGKVNLADLDTAVAEVESYHTGYPPGSDDVQWARAVAAAARGSSGLLRGAFQSLYRLGYYEPPSAELARLIREVLGNAINPSPPL